MHDFRAGVTGDVKLFSRGASVLVKHQRHDAPLAVLAGEGEVVHPRGGALAAGDLPTHLRHRHAAITTQSGEGGCLHHAIRPGALVTALLEVHEVCQGLAGAAAILFDHHDPRVVSKQAA